MCQMSGIDFPAWLQDQLDDKNWRVTDLAKHSHISDAAISRILKGLRKPDTDTLLAFSTALNISPIIMFRQAGKLPKETATTNLVEEIAHETSDMPEADQQEILAFIRMKNNLRNQRKKK
jgi:transcriptional regulator with XRE-family HTH domain